MALEAFVTAAGRGGASAIAAPWQDRPLPAVARAGHKTRYVLEISSAQFQARNSRMTGSRRINENSG